MAIITVPRTSLSVCGTPWQAFGSGSSILVPLEFSLQVAGANPTEFDCAYPEVSCQQDNGGIQVIIQVLGVDGLPADLSQSRDLSIKVKYPSGVVADFSATLLSRGADGRMFFVTSNSDLDEVGQYSVQGRYSVNGRRRTTRWGIFAVLPDIDPA